MMNQINVISLVDPSLLNITDFSRLLLRFTFNAAVILVIIKFLYSRYSRESNRKEFFFSYFAIGITVFLLCYLLGNVKIELGFALGLFAIFGIIRYRTDALPIKEMTYLFVVIGLSVINALTSTIVSYLELIFTNLIIIVALWILEIMLMRRSEKSLVIEYEKIENIKNGKEETLLTDLRARTGIPNIKRYIINKIDFLKDTATITVFFDDNSNDKTAKK